ncbi:Plasma membrane sulfite pump involved in sulfite metabolism [Naganishia albida]|nr:Plasma membrane sulfite pump involved in sulfite metabolism [Naganishia albida]
MMCPRILNFTPSWFSVNMGTGIVSILLYNLPYQFNGLHIIAVVIFCLNIALFLSFLTMSILRYAMWPSVFTKMLFHPGQSLFLGTFPMGFGTIVNMVAFVCVPNLAGRWLDLAWALWWIDSIFAVVIAIGVPFVMFTQHEHSLQGVTAVWLQPSVATIVSAATGSIVADYLDPSRARLTVVVSYIIWGLGFLPAILIMSSYFLRLAVHKCPPNALVVSSFLPLGPCGQGGFALLKLSTVVRKLCLQSAGTELYSKQDLRIFGNAVYAGTIPIAFVLWGFGLFWLVIALSTVISLRLKEKLRFNMGWWGFTFPLGVFSVCTTQLSIELDSLAFKVLGTILSLFVVALWIGVVIMTGVQAWSGALFSAPCLGEEEEDLLAKSSLFERSASRGRSRGAAAKGEV